MSSPRILEGVAFVIRLARLRFCSLKLNKLYVRACVRPCVCARVCARACVSACVRACVRACVVNYKHIHDYRPIRHMKRSAVPDGLIMLMTRVYFSILYQICGLPPCTGTSVVRVNRDVS